MATNRYTNLAWSSLRDLPHLTLPYEQLDNLLGSQQAKIDITKANTNLVPDYIQDSPSDRNLAGQIMKYQQDVKQQLADVAKTGNVSAYMQALNQVQDQVKRLYQPGGAADILKQRKAQKLQRDKQLDEFFKTNPKLADYYKKTTPYNEVGYNSQTGEYNNLNSFGNIKPHVEEKDINAWFNTNLDNVKDSLLREGVSKSKLDNITSLYDYWQVEGVPKEKLIGVFTTLFPKEFQDSLYQEEMANKFFSGDSTPLDTSLFTKDDKGNYKLNTNNPVARRIEGYSELASREKPIHQRIKDDNEIALEAYKSQLRQKEDRLKEGVFRLEGQSIGFNPNLLPKNVKDLQDAALTTETQIGKLQEELKSTADPQRQQYILSQIKWQDAIKQKQEDLLTRARVEAKPAGYDQFMNQYGFNEMTPQQLIEFQMAVESKSGGDVVNQVLSRGGKAPSIKEAQNILRQYKDYQDDTSNAQNKWLKENASTTNFQLGTISLAPEERTAIKASLNTDSWTFFDEKGVILNEEKGGLFGTDKKPIVSDNVEVGGITKHPFGDFGNLVTLTDSKGKVYYASMNNGNVGKAIGNTIKNKAPEGSDQWLLGEMLGNPNVANTLGQMTDMKYGDTRTIVSGTNDLGKVTKKQEKSGNVVYTLTAPDGVVLDKTGGKTKEFNNVTDLALSMEAINSALTQSKPK